MEGIVFLTREQVEQLESEGRKDGGDADSRKDRKKHSKKDRKKERRKSHSSKSRKREKRRRSESSSSSSSSASSSSSEDDEQERDRVEKRRREAAKKRDEAGLGWMNQPASSSSASGPSHQSALTVLSQPPVSTQALQPAREDLVFDTLAKTKQTSQTEEQERKDPLSRANSQFPKHLIVALGDHAFLMVPPKSHLRDGPFTQLWIVPDSHALSVRDASASVLEEIDKFKISVVKMFRYSGLMTVFIEQTSARYHSRTKLECIGIDPEMGETLPIVFQKELAESDQEWTDNPKVIDLSQKAMRHGLPPHTPYFFVEIFDTDPRQGPVLRCAHIIETEAFPREFGWGILQGIAGGETRRQGRKDDRKGPSMADRLEEERLRLVDMITRYKPFDWTVELDGGAHQQ